MLWTVSLCAVLVVIVFNEWCFEKDVVTTDGHSLQINNAVPLKVYRYITIFT